MRKIIVLSSVIVALLMLVSANIVFLKNVKSDPTIHYGDAYIGEMWLSELDVSGVVSEFDDIAITHVRAFNEWVAWEEGFGNITVNWSIDIQSIDHPEYYVVFGFDVYNIDNDSQVIGSCIYDVTIENNDDYSNSGSLTVFIKFTEDEMQIWDDVTLFCSLGAFIQLNGTEEAKDFTCSAADRSVVAVDFEMPMSEPNFEVYLDEANYHLPPVCSWIDGWEHHFSTESDMLNEQTFFQVGNDHEELQGQGYPIGCWLWGTMYCFMQTSNYIWPNTIQWTINEYRQAESNEKTWKQKDSFVPGTVSVGCKIDVASPELEGSIKITGTFWGAETFPPRPLGKILDKYSVLEFNGETWTHALASITAVPSVDDQIDPNEKTVDMFACITLWDWRPRPKLVTDYHLHYDENVEEQETLETTNYYWEEDCAYLNSTSEALSVDSSVYLGITTVEVDITQALCEEGMPIYSFAADRGEMRVEFVC
ncbi:MAG: hypothetical protein QHH15_00845 [Candidatus Thermoplasmatota archaeon]|jgi:hypothetical protein|nr:hypothetical protein [Candidatus Thermoplasmatota archaeon]